MHISSIIFFLCFLITDLENKWKMYFGGKTQRPYPKDMHRKEGETIKHTVQEKTTTQITESQTPNEKDLRNKIDDKSSGNQNENYEYILTGLFLSCTYFTN